MAVAAWLPGGFGCAEAPSPVAALTLGVDRAAALVGAPFDLQFRFDVAPDAGDGLPEDYRVFVHFLDDRDDVLWTADHERIAAADLGTEDIVELELRVDRTFTPAAIDDGSHDTRELGVRVYYTYFEPL